MRTLTHEEGCERIWNVLTKEFIGKNGRVNSIRLVEIGWSRKRGKQEFHEIPGSEFEIEAELVLLAMEFLHLERGPLVKEFGLETDAKGKFGR